MTNPETSKYLAKYRAAFMGKFFSDDIHEMSREDLLGLIGWMIEDKKSAVSARDDHISFMRDVYSVRTGKIR